MLPVNRSSTPEETRPLAHKCISPILYALCVIGVIGIFYGKGIHSFSTTGGILTISFSSLITAISSVSVVIHNARNQLPDPTPVIVQAPAEQKWVTMPPKKLQSFESAPGFFERERPSLYGEIAHIENCFLYPHVQQLVVAIRGEKIRSKKSDKMGILLVALGITPSINFRSETFAKLEIRDLLNQFPDITLFKIKEIFHVINEHPLSIFDPSKYLKNFRGSIIQKFVHIIPKYTLTL